MRRFNDEERAKLTGALLAKGQVIAQQLADVLAGRNPTRIEVVGANIDALRVEDRLRAYLAHINARRQALEADDGTYGLCEVCGAELSLASLHEMPWADRCVACSSAPLSA